MATQDDINVKISSDTFTKEFKLSKLNVLYGRSGTYKTVTLKSLFLAFSVLHDGCPKHKLTSLLVSMISESLKHDKCEGRPVKCNFEISLEDLGAIIDSSVVSLFSSLRLNTLSIELNGVDPLQEMKRGVNSLCRYKVRLGTFSFFESRCEGGKLVGTWSWHPEEEIPFPPDVITEALIPPSDGRTASLLPSGRHSLACLKRAEGELTSECFLNSLSLEDCTFPSLKLESLIFNAFNDSSFLFIEGVYGDDESLELLKEFIRRFNGEVLVIETRDERVSNVIKELGGNVVRF